MISSVGASTQNVNFSGIVKIRGVFCNDRFTSDEKTINSAIKIVKKILMKKGENPKQKIFADGVRKQYNYFDRDYSIPEFPVIGDTRYRFTHTKHGGKHYFVSGGDAASIDAMGRNIGAKKKSMKMAEGTKEAGIKERLYEGAKINYHDEMDSVASNYLKRALHPEMIIFASQSQKGKIGVHGIVMGNDTYKIDVAKKIDAFRAMMVKREQTLAEAVTKKNVVQPQIATKKSLNVAQKTTNASPQSPSSSPIGTIEKTNYFKDAKMSIDEFLKKQKEAKTAKKISSKKNMVDPNQMDFFSKLV